MNTAKTDMNSIMPGQNVAWNPNVETSSGITVTYSRNCDKKINSNSEKLPLIMKYVSNVRPHIFRYLDLKKMSTEMYSLLWKDYQWHDKTLSMVDYRKAFCISHTEFKNSNVSLSSCSCLCPIHWSQMLSQVWRCSWSSADRRCSNYIWEINKFIAY